MIHDQHPARRDDRPYLYSAFSPSSFGTASITSVSRLKRALGASTLSGPTIT